VLDSILLYFKDKECIWLVFITKIIKMRGQQNKKKQNLLRLINFYSTPTYFLSIIIRELSVTVKLKANWDGIVALSLPFVYVVYQRFPNFFQVGTTFISQNVRWTTLLLSPLKANCLRFSTIVCDTQFKLILFFLWARRQ
jgi:hypothetical protein